MGRQRRQRKKSEKRYLLCEAEFIGKEHDIQTSVYEIVGEID